MVSTNGGGKISRFFKTRLSIRNSFSTFTFTLNLGRPLTDHLIFLYRKNMMDQVDTKYILLAAVSVILSISTWAKYRGFEYIMKNYRWMFVCLFLLPISVVYDLALYLRHWVIYKSKSAPKKHGNKVKYVQEQVIFWFHYHYSSEKLIKMSLIAFDCKTSCYKPLTYGNRTTRTKDNSDHF